MPGKAAKVVITERQRDVLLAMSRSVTIAFQLRQRAQIILLGFEGRLNSEIEDIVGLGHDAVGRWWRRWQQEFKRLTLVEGLEEPADLRRAIQEVLSDEQRSGHPCEFTAEQLTMIFAVACEAVEESGRPVARWTQREIIDEVVKRGIVKSISTSHLSTRLSQAQLQPHKSRYWLNTKETDPEVFHEQVQTGLEAMDYVVADRFQVPPEAEPYYCERILRLPDGYVCYDPPAEAPDVADLPALRQGHVTFGCFNNVAKLNDDVVELWSEIMRRVPDSRLVLRYKGLDEEGLTARFRKSFAQRGIDAGRLELYGKLPYGEFLDTYNQIDMALDPFPFGGGTTTCEALWMGVPVITCPGETAAGRLSLSHLSVVGLTEMVAEDFPHYVELAVQLANDLPRLQSLRSDLRQRMARSPLCDAERFASNFIRAVRQIWQERVRSSQSASEN